MGDGVQVADTSFLYALFSKSDVFHERARKAATSADSLLIPSEIFSETVSLIQYRRGFVAARDAGAWMRSQKRIQILAASGSLLDRSWGIFRAARGRLSYPDALVLGWCRERRAKPLAFDSTILRRAK
ncbi:MAG TPA: PIN domain-containing protein [Thermoplasmata archaeon]|nr:PIN domain-containing protein [Thermoplasmata archaeon]